jgi:hypothetical protein
MASTEPNYPSSQLTLPTTACTRNKATNTFSHGAPIFSFGEKERDCEPADKTGILWSQEVSLKHEFLDAILRFPTLLTYGVGVHIVGTAFFLVGLRFDRHLYMPGKNL